MAEQGGGPFDHILKPERPAGKEPARRQEPRRAERPPQERIPGLRRGGPGEPAAAPRAEPPPFLGNDAPAEASGGTAGTRRRFPRFERPTRTPSPAEGRTAEMTASDRTSYIIGGIIIAFAILLWIFFLPPFSVLSGDDDDGFDLGGGIRAVPQDELPDVPEGLTPVSQFFEMQAPDDVVVDSITVDLNQRTEDGTNLGFYTYSDGGWTRVGGAELVNDGEAVRGTLERLPPNLAVMRNVNFGFQVQGWLPPGTEVEPEAASLLTVLNPIDYHPAADGSVTGIPTEIATAGNFAIAPTIVAGTEDEISALNAILGSGPLTAAHIDAIIALVEQGDYAGIDLDYRELDPSLGSQFTEFITALAARLHEQQRTLTITLPLPVRDSESWDTGPFDWTQLGETVDRIKIPTPDDQSIYAARMDDVLTFLTEQAPPSKMLLIVSPYSYVRVGEEITPVQLAEALSLATPVQIAEDESALVTGGTVTLVGTNLYRENNATGLQWDDTANMVTFAYQEGDTPTTVWLENQYSIGFKLQLVTRHRLGGIAVLDVSSNGLKANIWPPIRGMVEGGSLNLLKPNEQLLQPTWQIVDPNGQPVPDTALDGGMSGAVQWQIPATPGTYVVTLIVSDGTIRVGQEAQLLVAEGSAPSDAATAPADQPPDAADAPVDEPTLVPGDGGEPADTAVAE